MNNVKLTYPNERTKAGELMSKEVPLQKIDYAHHRKTDRKPEYQDGSGALGWIAAAVVCNVLLVIIGVFYG